MIKAVVFDLFGTLVIWLRPDPEEDLIKEFGLALSYNWVERIF